MEWISLGSIPYDGIRENQGCFECYQEHATKDRLETFGCVRPMRQGDGDYDRPRPLLELGITDRRDRERPTAN